MRPMHSSTSESHRLRPHTAPSRVELGRWLSDAPWIYRQGERYRLSVLAYHGFPYVSVSEFASEHGHPRDRVCAYDERLSAWVDHPCATVGSDQLSAGRGLFGLAMGSPLVGGLLYQWVTLLRRRRMRSRSASTKAMY